MIMLVITCCRMVLGAWCIDHDGASVGASSWVCLHLRMLMSSENYQS